MRPLRRIAAVFLALSGIVVVGSIFLPALNAPYAGSARLVARPWILDAAGLVWMFALWGALVAFMVFLIGWIAEGMGTAASELDASPSFRMLERQPPSGPMNMEQANERTRGETVRKAS